METLILAGRMNDASKYAEAAGLKKHTWRWVNFVEQMRGLHPKTVVELPTFYHKGNRHVIVSHLRYIRGGFELVRVTDEEWAEMTRPKGDLPAPEHFATRCGEQLDIYDALGMSPHEVAAPANSNALEAVVAAKVAEEQPRPKAPKKRAVAKKPADPNAFFE